MKRYKTYHLHVIGPHGRKHEFLVDGETKKAALDGWRAPRWDEPYTVIKMVEHEDPVECRKCRGHCCKTYPGECFPGDFSLPDEYTPKLEKRVRVIIDKKIVRGKYILDRHLYISYIRPRTHSERGSSLAFAHASFKVEGPCIFWHNAHGCLLTYRRRPRGCRGLQPHIDPIMGRNCRSTTGGGKGAAEAWISYNDLFDVIMDERGERI